MGKVYKVRITRQAFEQLAEIRDYISDELLVPEIADRLMETFRREIAGLCEFPERIPLTEEEPWRTEGIHRMPVKNFLIYFWIDEAHDKVQVTAVVYGRRDQRQMLSEMEKE